MSPITVSGCVLILFVGLSPMSTIRIQHSSTYEFSNIGIQNVQVSSPIIGTATDLRTNHCIKNAGLNGSLESMLLVDPSNPNHLVGATHFIYEWSSDIFSGSVGEVDSEDGGTTWNRHLISGFDCAQPNFTGAIGTYDPAVAIDRSGNIYSAVLPVFRGQLPLYVAKSLDFGSSWTIANGGKPIFEPSSNVVADREWILVDNGLNSSHYDMIYVVWIAFIIDKIPRAEIMLTKSANGGESFSAPVRVSPPSSENVSYVNPIPAVAPDGTLYVSFASIFPERSEHADSVHSQRVEYVVKSVDGGMSFSSPIEIARTIEHSYINTRFSASPYQSFTVNPANGHLLLAIEHVLYARTEIQLNESVAIAEKSDISLYESVDDGMTWNTPLKVNDNPSSQNETAFQPVVAVSPTGNVAVAFYDRRLSCPSQPWVLPDDVGKGNLCVDTAIQFYADEHTLTPLGSNIRVTKYSWDPLNPGSLGSAAGLRYLWFIGDHFGLAMTNTSAYTLFTGNFDLGQNHGNDVQIFAAEIPIKTTTSVMANSSTSTQTVITSQNAPSIDAQTSLQFIAGVALVIVATCVWISLRKRRRDEPTLTPEG
jgi:hypothetical protein